MAIKVRLPDGREGELNEEQFEALKENWNEYRLADGTIVKFKVVVTAIGRVLNDRGEITYNADGLQNVMVRSSNVVHVVEPQQKQTRN